MKFQKWVLDTLYLLPPAQFCRANQWLLRALSMRQVYLPLVQCCKTIIVHDCTLYIYSKLKNDNAKNKDRHFINPSLFTIFYSYGDRQMIGSLLRKLQHQSKEQLRARKPEMIASLKKLGDFVVDLKWDFTSWLPLVSRILPSDICKISKKGACIRLDTTLVDFTEMRWERGDITFLYKGDAASPEESLFVLDNKMKVYQKVRYEESDVEFEDEVDLLMSSDIASAQVSTKPINFVKVQSGWFFKEDRQELVGTYNANFYSINGMVLETRKRREHLSNDDLIKNKALLENFAKGNAQYLEQQQQQQNNGGEIQRKESLPPPPKRNVTWEEYIQSPPGQHPVLGRTPKCKESSRAFKATVAMSEDFPLTVDMLLNVLEVCILVKHSVES